MALAIVQTSNQWESVDSGLAILQAISSITDY